MLQEVNPLERIAASARIGDGWFMIRKRLGQGFLSSFPRGIRMSLSLDWVNSLVLKTQTRAFLGAK